MKKHAKPPRHHHVARSKTMIKRPFGWINVEVSVIGQPLNFLTRHPNVFAIPKTTHPERIKENAGAVGWKPSAQEMDAIDRAFPAPAFVTALGTL